MATTISYQIDKLQDIINALSSRLNLDLKDSELALLAIQIQKNQIEIRRNEILADVFMTDRPNEFPGPLEKIAMNLEPLEGISRNLGWLEALNDERPPKV